MVACDKSIKQAPKSWESLKSRATLFYMIQDFGNSLSDFQSVLEHSPNDEVSAVSKQNIGVVETKVNKQK
jgi:regulator of sirC expression with transglutaminase-like and TPR domain